MKIEEFFAKSFDYLFFLVSLLTISKKPDHSIKTI